MHYPWQCEWVAEDSLMIRAHTAQQNEQLAQLQVYYQATLAEHLIESVLAYDT